MHPVAREKGQSEYCLGTAAVRNHRTLGPRPRHDIRSGAKRLEPPPPRPYGGAAVETHRGQSDVPLWRSHHPHPSFLAVQEWLND
jgi:hypothetical protein